MNSLWLTLAVPKGRLFEESLDFLMKIGLITERVEEGRKLVVDVGSLRLYLVKPFDVPVYVENGVADLGIVGLDVLLERPADVYRLYDLGFGFCRIAVAGRPEFFEDYKKSTHLKVATKYPNITKEFFSKKGIKTSLVVLNGSVELAPLLGLSECIVDLVQTGRTLKENNLIVYEEIGTSTAQLICNRVSYRTKRESILKLVRTLLEVC